MIQQYQKVCAHLLFMMIVLTLNLACKGESTTNSAETNSPLTNTSSANVHSASLAKKEATKPTANNDYANRILIVGDSLSAAYGIPLKQGWVSLLEKRLHSESYDYQVVNSSISGETTGGALKRLTHDLDRYTPDIVIIELGGNDGLRGTPLKTIKNNLQKMINMSQAVEAQIVMLAMRIPPNYGARYSEQFNQNYHQLAQSYSLPLVPFFLANIATQPRLMQADGIHPKATAQREMLDQVWPHLEPLL